jgi:N utilization substance protein A
VKSDFLIALTQLAAERHLPKEQVLQAIEVALASAFKKDSLVMGQNISVKLNPNSGEVNVYATKTVVDELEDDKREVLLKDAQKVKKDIALGDELAIEALPHQVSRIAAQTAKQVVLQRLREVERELVYAEFQDREGEVISGVIDQIEAGRIIIIDLGRAQAVLLPEEQIPTERYRKGQRLKLFVLEVRRSAKGPEILVSRNHRNLLKRLFEVEVPEVYNGIVEIKAISREAGSRSKVAVMSRQEGIDPVGSCIGMRGNRIQSIVNELQGEKIDLVRWDKDPRVFIANALSPSEVVHVDTTGADESAIVVVPERQLSLAIGKEGQNARLAAKLVNFRLDIKSMSEWEEIKAHRQANVEEAARAATLEKQVEAPVVATASVAETEPVEVVAEELEAVVAEAEQIVEEAAQALALEAAVDEADAPVLEVVAEVAVQEAIAPDAVQETAKLSPEEELALLDLDEEEEEQDDDDEDGEETAGDEDVWKVPAVLPAVAGTGQIRFAEDIIGNVRSAGRSGRKGKRGRGGGGRSGGRGRSARQQLEG